MFDAAWYGRMMTIFREEAERCLEVMREATERLAADSTDATARAELARAAHTIKGNAAALGLRRMMEEAQRVELWAMLPNTPPTPAMHEGLAAAEAEIRLLLEEACADVTAAVA